jgi:putative lipoic acid-binding regulatory protein
MTQKKASDNNNANQSIKDAKIEFPVTFELKAVLDASSADDENMKKLSTVFKKLKISNSYINNKKSSKGTYVSYNYKVTLLNKPQLEKLYSDLKSVPGLKFAL